MLLTLFFFFFFFNDTATTEIYTLSLHDALPISTPTCWTQRCSPGYGSVWERRRPPSSSRQRLCSRRRSASWACASQDRKSTRLNSSHLVISYAVFCLKKKKRINTVLKVHVFIN